MARAQMPPGFFEIVSHHPPPERPVGPKGGRPRVGHRIVMRVIWFVLTTGARWEDVPPELGCSGRTAHRRLRAWEEAGIRDRLHTDLWRSLRKEGELDPDTAIIDGVTVRAFGGGEATGPSPVDRRKKGTKHTLLVDRHGVPPAIRTAGANASDHRGGRDDPHRTPRSTPRSCLGIPAGTRGRCPPRGARAGGGAGGLRLDSRFRSPRGAADALGVDRGRARLSGALVARRAAGMAEARRAGGHRAGDPGGGRRHGRPGRRRVGGAGLSVRRRVAGRIVVDDRYCGIWEPTARQLDTERYGDFPTYSFTSLAEWLGKWYAVDANTSRAYDDELLSGYDILILKTPEEPMPEAEVAAIDPFVRRGGGLLLVGDHTNLLGMGTHLNALSARYGIRFRYDSVSDGLKGGFVDHYGRRIGRHEGALHVDHLHFMTSCSLQISGDAEAVTGLTLCGRCGHRALVSYRGGPRRARRPCRRGAKTDRQDVRSFPLCGPPSRLTNDPITPSGGRGAGRSGSARDFL